MKSILTKLAMGLICASLATAPAGAAIERKAAPKTEATTSTAANTVAAAANSFKASKLTRAEKREARKALFAGLRAADSTTKLIAALIAIFVIGIGPAIAMFIIDKDFTKRVLIALLLGLLLFHLPGMIYALIQIFGKGKG